MKIAKEFKNPSKQFRPIPFWSWNDELDPEELKYQIKELKKAGNGGFFMHARSGLKTEYLSQEWFHDIKTGIDAAKEEGMNAWIYDEEGWPSGFAGGIVPELSPDFHAKYITMHEFSSTEEIDRSMLLCIYLQNVNTKVYKKLEQSYQGTCSGEETFLAIYRHTNPFYIDTLNKRAIDAFLACTHEAYYERYGESFGTDMQGFFTDEPRLTCNNFGDLAWSDDLPGVFLELHGYDIMEHLPVLFAELDAFEKYRYDFWETVSKMFAEHYMKTIYDWCELHHCKSTGHIMMEESIFSQMTSTAGVMPFYEYMHVPGIDWLRRRIDSPVIGKQVGSVACQLGKKQVLTESYALCGWNVSFEELKWIAEWQFVNGVNQICQHLMGYTIKGVRKRDYPPSHFTQQTWWEEAGNFNDYLGRLCVALSEGDQTADVLMIHPMRSGFLAFDGTRTDAMKRLDQEFIKASECLSGYHISYHYGDESIIKNHGSIEDACFRVGRISYKTVILPCMYGIDKFTLELLLEFAKNGGTILSLSDLPHFTNGSNQVLEELENNVKKVAYTDVRKIMEEEKLVSLSICEDQNEISDISYLQRETSDGTLFFLVNHSQEKRHFANVKILGKRGTVWHMTAENGEISLLESAFQNGDTRLELSFEPMQSYLLMVKKEEKEAALDNNVGENSKQQDLVQKVVPNAKWEVEELSLNSLTLDLCSYRMDEGEWEPAIPAIKLQNLLLEQKRPANVEMKFTFEIDMDLQSNKEFYVVIEDASLYQITINEKTVYYDAKKDGWWKDKSFHKVPIKEYVKCGMNEITLKTLFKQPQKVYDVLFGENVYETEKNKITYDIELESIYLLGDFGVISKTPFHRVERQAMLTDGPFLITDAPKYFKSNDFTTEGLLFFAGELMVKQTLLVKKEDDKKVVLCFGKQNAPLVQIYLNKKLIKNSLWAPYEIDITDCVLDGENELEFKLYASNRNLLGPHHHIKGECYNVGPESFTGKWSWVERESESDATDIADRTKSYWQDSYCFVEFGPCQEIETN